MGIYQIFKNQTTLLQFFETISFGIFVLDKESKIIALNHAGKKMLSMSQKIIGHPFTDFLDTASKNTYLRSFQDLMGGRLRYSIETLELSIINDKEPVPVGLNFNTSLLESDGQLILLVNNITRRKQLEEEIEIQRQEHEEIEDELQKEQNLSELKSRFVTMASHEFRTPLAGILSSVNLVERYIKSEEINGVKLVHKPKIENHFDKIKESVNNLTTILNEFLSLGKLEEGDIKCHWENIDLPELISRLTSELQKLCKKNQIIVTQMEEERTHFLLDQMMITNIINNLISNAIKYSDENQSIHLKLYTRNNILVIQVKDEGIGIPSRDQKKLFGRFFRAENTVNIQGTGLGLNIVKRYIEMMGGAIGFESELNKGTTFTVQIPIKDAI